jgi:hypothetical protein
MAAFAPARRLVRRSWSGAVSVGGSWTRGVSEGGSHYPGDAIPVHIKAIVALAENVLYPGIQLYPVKPCLPRRS